MIDKSHERVVSLAEVCKVFREETNFYIPVPGGFIGSNWKVGIFENRFIGTLMTISCIGTNLFEVAVGQQKPVLMKAAIVAESKLPPISITLVN